MGDVICAKCAEPWDSYSLQKGIYTDPEGHGDLTQDEAERFLKGEGCPSCGFGEHCPICNGTGKDKGVGYGVSGCCTNGLRLCWSPSRSEGSYQAGRWYSGYSPNVVEVPQASRDGGIQKDCEGHPSRDGWVRQGWFQCWDCNGAADAEECLTCKGTGKVRGGDDLALDAARIECEESDEEPIGILVRRGVL
jgi:hypothetical protein